MCLVSDVRKSDLVVVIVRVRCRVVQCSVEESELVKSLSLHKVVVSVSRPGTVRPGPP